jgi:WhiB family redox-sensing transcriptional regulator
MSETNWTEGRQACRPEDLELFYPIARGGRFSDANLGADAKAICARCDIRDLCLSKALEEERGGGERHGIRGGLLGAERGKLERRMRYTKADKAAS